MTEFILSDFVKPAVRNISSLLTGNSVKIYVHKRLPSNGSLGARLQMLSKCFTSITEDVIRNFLGYGFASCQIDPATGAIQVIDYRTGDVFFTYDATTNEYTFVWVRNIFRGSRGIDPYTDIRQSERRIEPNCVHYIDKAPTDEGILSGSFAPLIKKFRTIQALNAYSAETEKRKLTTPHYYKLQFPPLKAEEYTTMLEHTLSRATGMASGGDFASANNMKDNGTGVTESLFGHTQRSDLREIARRMSQFMTMDSVRLDKKTNKPVAGPLVDLVFMPLHESSDMAQRLSGELRDSILEYVACYQFLSTTKGGNVKEYAGQVGMFLNPLVMKLKSTMDGFCTVLARESLADLIGAEVDGYLAARAERRARRRESWLNERERERIAEQEARGQDMTDEERARREKEDELERLSYEAKEVAAYEMLQAEMMSISVQYDPMLYVSDTDKEMLLKTTLDFSQIIKPIFGGDGKSFGNVANAMTLENAKLALEWAKIDQRDREIKAKAVDTKDAAKKADDDKEEKPKKKKPKKKKPKKQEVDDEDDDEEDDDEEDDEENAEEEEEEKPKKKPKKEKPKKKKPKKKEKKE